MTAEDQAKKPDLGGYQKTTVVNTSQSDIRSMARAELKRIQRSALTAIPRTADRMSRYHLEDVAERVDHILEPQ
jgi:hypothetical protein